MSTGFDLEEFPTSESAKRQLSYVTKGFYDTSYIGKWIYQVMGLEYEPKEFWRSYHYNSFQRPRHGD